MMKDLIVTFKKGEIIFKEGEEGNVAYIVDKGSVELSKKGRMHKAVAEIVRDGIFALLPLIDNQSRQYTAVAREDTVCTVITQESFEKHLSASSPVVRAAVHYLSRSIREATERMASGGVLDADRGDTN